MQFELFVAARYLRAKRRQAVIGVITVISVVGVAAGVASLIIALAINNGFRQDLQDRLLGSTSHINLLRIASDGIRNWQPLLERLEKQPHVVAGAPAIYEQVLISRGARAQGAILKGIIPQDERKVSAILDSIKQGSATSLDEALAESSPATTPSDDESDSASARAASLPPIILGKDMADELGATVGSLVTVTSPQGELTPFGIVPKYKRFKVAGIFASGFFDYDNTWAFIRLSDAQRLFDLTDVVSVLEFKVDDIYQAGVIGQQLETEAGKGFMSTNWMEQNRALFHALRLERIVTFITIGLIVFVAALNILISLIMMVMEKTRDIAVLVSMGAKTPANPPHLYVSGNSDRRDRHGAGIDRRLCAVMGGRSLPSFLALRRGVLHRLRAFRAAAARRPAGGAGRHWRVVHRDSVSFVVCRRRSACRGAAVRVATASPASTKNPGTASPAITSIWLQVCNRIADFQPKTCSNSPKADCWRLIPKRVLVPACWPDFVSRGSAPASNCSRRVIASGQSEKGIPLGQFGFSAL